MHILKKIIAIAFLLPVFILALLFFLKNKQAINVDYLISSVELPLALLMFLCLLIGVLLGLLAWLPKIFRLRRKLLKAERSANQSKKELDNLRTIPVKDSL